MKCPICDAQLADTAKFCGVCGCAVTPAAPSNPVPPVQAQPAPQWNAPQQPVQQPVQQWNNPVPPVQTPQNQYYSGVNNQPYAPAQQNMYYANQPAYNAQPVNQPKKGMAWYKFLIYFALFAGALINLSQGFMFFSGSVYEIIDGIDTDFVYDIFRDLETADQFYGVLLILTAVIDIVARFSLAGFKKIGPTMINIAYILPFVSSILYIIMVIGAVGEITDATLTSFFSIFTSFIFMIANAIYFKKRKYMFVN